jgi:hypothetical protein
MRDADASAGALAQWFRAIVATGRMIEENTSRVAR